MENTRAAVERRPDMLSIEWTTISTVVTVTSNCHPGKGLGVAGPRRLACAMQANPQACRLPSRQKQEWGHMEALVLAWQYTLEPA